VNQTLHFKFAVSPSKNEMAERKFRRVCGITAIVCLLLWILCLFLKVPQFVEDRVRGFGMMFAIFYVVRFINPPLKERARWGGIDLDTRELAVNTLNGPKQKIPLAYIQGWKIQREYLIIRWTKSSKSWFKNRDLIVPFKDLENPEEFLAEFEKHVAATRNQASFP